MRNIFKINESAVDYYLNKHNMMIRNSHINLHKYKFYFF